MPSQIDFVSFQSEVIALPVGKENERRIVDLICRSNHLDDPFEVTAYINGAAFHVRGVLSHPYQDWPEVTICLSAEERLMLLAVRPGCLKPWENWERTFYSGFYIPLDWADNICAERERIIE